MSNLSMYMVTHKKVSFVPNGRIPIFVGLGENKGNYLQDNTGDNISDKNLNYCELTAYYWIWKNNQDSEYIAIEHYRRFFMPSGCFFPKIASKEYLLDEIKKYDIITSKEYKVYTSIWQFYKDRHHIEDMECVRDGIQEFYPDYLSCFDNVMNQNKIPMFNMVVLSKKHFDEYCEWLFKILFYVEHRTDLSNRTDFQKRVYGFLAERMLEVWIKKNKLKCKRNPIYKLSSSKLRTICVTQFGRLPITYHPRGAKH